MASESPGIPSEKRKFNCDNILSTYVYRCVVCICT